MECSKKTRWNFFFLQNFDKHDQVQLLTQFKKILYLGFRATLNFRKFKVALNLICFITVIIFQGELTVLSEMFVLPT